MSNPGTKFKETDIGAIPEDWKVLPIYNLAQWINGLAFKSEYFSSKGKPIIKINELKYGITDQTQFTEQVFPDDYLLKKRDLLFSWSGSPDTSIDAFWYDLPEGWLNQHIFKVRPNENVRSDFLYYILKAHKQRFVEIARDKQTTGLGHVTLADIKRFFVALPLPHEQVKIAEVLSSLDEKIELNRKINSNFEKFTAIVFKNWCTYFGDDLPKDWKMGTLADIGYNPRHSVSPIEIKELTPYIGLEHMPRKSISLSEWEAADDIKSGKFVFTRGDILFGKLRPYFHKVGIAPVDGVCSTDILVLKPKAQDGTAFLLSIVSSNAFINYVSAAAEGTKMPRTDWKTMSTYPVLIPPPAIIKQFNETINPLFEMINENIRQINILITIRDSLLPRLMSGKIRV